MTDRADSAPAPGEIDPILASIDSFLERQMDRFPPPDDYPPKFADAQLIQTYDVEASDPRFGPFLCAEHVRQLGGVSPLPNQMEVKG